MRCRRSPAPAGRGCAARLPAPRSRRPSLVQEAAINAGEQTPPARGGSRSSSSGSGTPAAWLDAWLPEDPPLAAARQRAGEVGVGAVEPAAGATLRMLAAVAGARTVVEVGTGTGVSSLWLLRGMRPDGVLTSVDSDSEHQRLARLALTEAGIPGQRARLITGRALEVLPRLSDHAYDMVFLDAARSENEEYLDAAMRLLRPGGVVIFAGALAGRVSDSSSRDPDAVALRELGRRVREETRLVPALLPVGSGLLVAVLAG